MRKCVGVEGSECAETVSGKGQLRCPSCAYEIRKLRARRFEKEHRAEIRAKRGLDSQSLKASIEEARIAEAETYGIVGAHRVWEKMMRAEYGY